MMMPWAILLLTENSVSYSAVWPAFVIAGYAESHGRPKLDARFIL